MDSAVLGLSSSLHGDDNDNDLLGDERQEAKEARVAAFKRYTGVPPGYTAAVARRNERERNRVRQVNNGFVVLRQKIPSEKSNKKMSKVETLRCAVDYIRRLQQLLDAEQSSGREAQLDYAAAAAAAAAYSSPAGSPAGSPSSSLSLRTSAEAPSSASFYQQDWFDYY